MVLAASANHPVVGLAVATHLVADPFGTPHLAVATVAGPAAGVVAVEPLGLVDGRAVAVDTT